MPESTSEPPLLPPTAEEELTAQAYCDAMARIQQRLAIIQQVIDGTLLLPEILVGEVIFLQFRKSLEDVAYATISANREEYKLAWPKYHEHWRADKILACVERLNPAFFPVPIQGRGDESSAAFADVKHFDKLPGNHLSRSEFIELYDRCADFMHVKNPWDPSAGKPIDVRLPVSEWLAKLRALIACHYATLPDGRLYIAFVPASGEVHLKIAVPA